MIKARGFTIVELLIVIIVISILASVTVVAFNGVQKRAANSAVAAAVTATEKAVRMHYTQAGAPIKADEQGWGHGSIVTMTGSCITKQWPTLAEMQAIHGGYGIPDIYQAHCGVNGGDGAVTRRDVQERLNTAVAASPAKDAFNTIPAFPPITVEVGGTGSTVRGVRYAFDNSTTSPRSFIFYPLNGKQCQAGDASVNPNNTSMPAVGGSVWTDSFTTGGDYTSNNTVYCVRTLRY